MVERTLQEQEFQKRRIWIHVHMQETYKLGWVKTSYVERYPSMCIILDFGTSIIPRVEYKDKQRGHLKNKINKS